MSNKKCPLGISETDATVGVGYDAMVMSVKMSPCPICEHEMPTAAVCTGCSFKMCFWDMTEERKRLLMSYFDKEEK